MGRAGTGSRKNGWLLATLAALLAVFAVAPGMAQAAPPKGKGVSLINDSLPLCFAADTLSWFNSPPRAGLIKPERCKGVDNQVWFMFGAAASTGGSTMRIAGPPNGPANRCLDAFRNKRFFGGYKVVLFGCNGAQSQQWQWSKARGTSPHLVLRPAYTIRNVRYGRCLTQAATQGTSLGAALTPCDGSPNQVWHTLRPLDARKDPQ